MTGYGIEDETALVLGGTRGLGFACAQSLAAAGVRVIINGRDRNAAEDAAARLSGAAQYILGDISNPGERRTVLTQAKALGPISILVTNTGGPPAGQFLELNPDAWEDAFGRSVMFALDAIKELLPDMIARRFGRIVNITSFVVKEPYPNMTLSNTMRIALTGAMASLAREVMEHGVTINNMLPGLMDTGALKRVYADRSRRSGLSESEVKAQMAQSIPAKRLGTAEDFGPLCAFLCPRAAAYITGQNICVDGGLVRSLI